MEKRRKGPIKKSTQAFYREGRKVEEYSLFDFLHGYVYGRWPYLYIGVGTGEHPLTGWLRPLFNLLSTILSPRGGDPRDEIKFADTYHGKVMPVEAATELVRVEEEISHRDLEPIIPYKKARDIILKNPDHIVVLDCPCRSVRENPCLPLDVCLIVGEPFASFVLEHQPRHARSITQHKAEEILHAEHRRGHVHHAFFKDAMLERFYAICNCCACCCGAMQAQRSGTPMLASSGYTARLDEGLCTACGTCEEVCQFQAVTVTGKSAAVSERECMGCGVCVGHCPEDALELVLTPEKGQPLMIRSLLAQSREGAVRKI